MMRWFTKRIDRNPRRQNRNSRRLRVESMEDRVCLTTMVIINDGGCGIQDDNSQTSYPCEDAVLFDGDLLTWQEVTGESNAADEPHFPTEEETKELIKKLVAIVNSQPVAGIEGSDIGSGGLTGDSRADETSDEPQFPTEEETKELIKKLVAIVNSDQDWDYWWGTGFPGTISEGSDIGSGSLTGDSRADGTSDEPHFPTEEETKELIKKLVAIVNNDPVAGIEGSDIGSGGLTGDPNVDGSDVVRQSP